MSEHFDVIVAGGGMVGGVLAAALGSARGAGEPLSVCVLEAARPEPFEIGSDPAHDIRVSAVSVASERLFRAVGAWDGVIARRACRFRRMRVWDGEADAATHKGTEFDAHEVGVPALGHIVENRVLQLALLDCIETLPSVTLRCPARLAHYRLSTQADGASQAAVTLESGETLTASLLVGADGARSTVREQAGITMSRSVYEQRAMVATVSTALPQQDITWQRFVPTGPQAMLPLSGHHASLVWYHNEDEIQRLSALDEATFIEELEGAFPAELGSITAVHQRASFPIAKALAESYIGDRIALVGDACHTVHPLAGQGVNLGMLDAGALAETLRDARLAGQDIGARRTLRRYERWRRGENAMMATILDGFHKAFSPQAAPVRGARALALDVAGHVNPARKLVTRYASGLAGDLPRLARTGEPG